MYQKRLQIKKKPKNPKKTQKKNNKTQKKPKKNAGLCFLKKKPAFWPTLHYVVFIAPLQAGLKNVKNLFSLESHPKLFISHKN